jgi:hypothetical protein
MSQPLIGQLCMQCRHIREDWTCDAFPDGIPPAIFRGDADHTQLIRGDHGIHFEPRPPEEPMPDFIDLMLAEIASHRAPF